jgi:hypothetical protein
MALSRKKALLRLESLSVPVMEHLEKIRSKPDDQDVPHWKREVRNWLDQMEDVLDHVGKNTEKEWQVRIEEWRLGVEES